MSRNRRVEEGVRLKPIRRILAVGLAASLLGACSEPEAPPLAGAPPREAAPATPAPAAPAVAAPDVAANDAEAERRRQEIDATAAPQEWEPEVAPTAAESLDDTLRRADASLAAGRIESGSDNALGLYLSVLERDAGNERAQQGVESIVQSLLARGAQALDEGRLDAAAQVVPVLQRLRPEDAAVADYAQRVDDAREIALTMVEADRLAANGRILDPHGANAAELYRKVLQRVPDHAGAQAALAKIESDLVARATAAAEAGDYGESDRLLAEAARVRPGSGSVQNASTRIVEMRQDRASELLQQGLAAVEQGDLDLAQSLLEQLGRVSAQAQGIEEFRLRIENARVYGNFAPAQSISDALAGGGNAPELTVIPIGTFRMGSPRGEDDRKNNEGPQHEITLSRGFAIARAEITVAQFRAFVEATGYVASAYQAGRSTIYDERTGSMAERAGVGWEDDHSGRRAAGNLPVVHVSWNDAKAYADWLTRETGASYRLPSEAEFEYVLRAGGDTRYPWGDDAPARVVANLTGDKDRSDTQRSWSKAFADYDDGHWGPAPVRSYDPNRFRVHDIDGNVSEWVEDCWHDSYSRAPADGSPWVNPGCNRRVVRGASWASAPDQARSAFRLSSTPGSTNARLGFRVVRELLPAARPD
jgi:formylglycine-generating enzyme required for sulfatase activity